MNAKLFSGNTPPIVGLRHYRDYIMKCVFRKFGLEAMASFL